MRRIICVGNRYSPQDAAGPMIHDHLVAGALPCGVEVIDGGLAGLDLLRFLEGARRVVFVDAVFGLDRPDGVVVLDTEDVTRHGNAGYDHSAGLVYLLRVLPHVCEGAIPQIRIVGIQGVPDRDIITSAAEMSLRMAVEGLEQDRASKVCFTGAGA